MPFHNLLTKSESRLPKKLLQDFYEHYNVSSYYQVRMAIILCIFLYGGFGLLEYRTVPAMFPVYLKIRLLIVIPIALLILASTYHPVFRKTGQLLLTLLTLTAGGGIIAMIQLAPQKIQETYYVGLILVFMFAFAFLRLRFLYSLIAGTFLITVYSILQVYNGISSDIIYNNSFFLTGALFIGILSSYYHELHARKAFMLRLSLEEEKVKTEMANVHLEQRVADRTEKLNEMNKNLKVAMQQAEVADKLKSNFLANLSHEIRTPMNGILGFTELLLEDNSNQEERDRQLRIIYQNSNRLLKIIDELVDISKIESGIVDVYIQEFNPGEILDQCIELFSLPEANPNQLDLVKNYPENQHITMKSDKVKLMQVLTNLLQNAIKYTEQGRVTMGYHHSESSVTFFVEDTGRGIPADKRELIFNRYAQHKPQARSHYSGLGLGLAISKTYIELLRGTISFTSEEGRGTRFTIELPLRY